MANVLTRLGEFSTFIVRFLLMTKILCVAGRRVPLDD